MLSSVTNLVGIALAAASVASTSAIDPRQLNAQSVPTFEFKARFEQSRIVPEVIAALDPSVSFYAAYKTVNVGLDGLLVPGSTLTTGEAQFPFEFMVENLQNASGVTTATRYLIYLLDCDAPSRDDPSARNMRHYLAGNYTLSNRPSSVLGTATRLFLPSNMAFPFTPFQQPNPTPNTGVHRYIYALYTQPPQFNFANFDSVGMPSETSNWNLAEWRTQLGLGPAIGATFFTIDTTQNNGQGVSGQIDVRAGLAPGMSAPAFVVAAVATLVAFALM